MARRRTQKTIRRLKRGPRITGAPLRGRDLAYRKRLISRKPKKKVIEIVSRRGQPIVVTEVKRLKKQRVGGNVSSSWIAALEWMGRFVKMSLIEGRVYNVYISFDIFENWFYAHSKGTFFNGKIKDKYYVVRVS